MSFSFPHPPATPTPCTAETHHNPGALQHPPGATEEHLKAPTLSPINSKQYLQLRFSPRPRVPPRGSILPRRTAREITQWRGVCSLPEEPRAVGAAGLIHPVAARKNNQCLVIKNSRVMLGGCHRHHRHTHSHTRLRAHTSHGGTCVSRGSAG